MTIGEIYTDLEEVDGSAGVTHIDIIGGYIEHLGVAQGEFGLSVSTQGFEGCDVIGDSDFTTRTWSWGRAASDGLGEINLVGTLIRHQDTLYIVSFVSVELQSHFEAVVYLDLIIANIGIIVGVAAFLSGGDLHTLNLDKVAIIGFRLGLGDGQHFGLCGTSGEGDVIGIGVVGLGHLRHVVIEGQTASDGAVEDLAVGEVDADLVKVDGSGGVTHIDIIGGYIKHLGVAQGEFGLGVSA